MENLVLSNGVLMPPIGFGVSKAEEGEEATNAVCTAIEAGYRLIDTAYRYFNEKSVGAGIRKSSIARDKIFVTTKVANPSVRAGQTLQNFEESLENLGLDYVDLYLLHWPVDGKEQAWKVLESLYEQGRARAIGVCNFHQMHFDDLMKVAKIKPMVNQIESNPSFNNQILIDKCQKDGMIMQAWSPLGGGGTSMRDDESIAKIGAKYNKTTVQVILRWNVQRKVVALPKSVTKERIYDNINIFDFMLTEEEMAIMNALNKNTRTGGDPENFNF